MKKLLLSTLVLLSGGMLIAQSAINLPNTNDRVETNYNFNLTGFTVEFDMYVNSLAINGQAGVTKTNNNVPAPFDTYVHSNGVFTVLVGNGGAFNGINLPAGTINAEQWYHIALTVDPVVLKVYVNGVLMQQMNHGVPLANSPGLTKIGNRNDFATDADARFKNVRIWSDIRTDAEILANKDLCLTGSEANLDVLYQMDEGTGAVLNDLATGNGVQDGTIVNGYVWSVGASCTCSISNQTVSIDDTELCPTNTGTTVNTDSELNYDYYLRDNSDNTILQGPIAGTGNQLNFNTGALTGDMTYNVVAKETHINNAMHFDDANDYINCGSNSNLDITTSLTIESWVYRDALNGDDCIIGKDNWAGNTGYSLWIFSSDNKLSLRFGNTGYPSNSVIPINTWTHVAATFDNAGNVTLYVNGVEDGTYTGIAGPNFNSGNLYIGTPQDAVGNTAYGFAGSVDEVRIWNVARTGAEINTNMDVELLGNESGLVSYYNFNQGNAAQNNATVTTVIDLTSENNDGAVTNMALTGATSNWVQGAPITVCSLEMATTVSVTVQDILTPVADAATLTTLTGLCSVSAPTAPTATDACEGTITGTTTTIFPITALGNSTITWTFDDGNGNTSTQDQAVTVNAITDQAVTITDSELCLTNSGTTISTGSSEVGVDYYLRDDADNSIIEGPITGTGSGLTFNTGVLATTTTYNINSYSGSGKALEFDGIDDNVQLSHFNRPDVMTIEVWVKNTNSAGPEEIFAWSNSAGGFTAELVQNGGNVYYAEWDGANFPMSITADISDGNWHHIAVVRDGNLANNVSMYRDGVLLGTSTVNLNITTDDLRIGAYNYFVVQRFYSGSVDNLRVWDYARTNSDITNDMNSCLSGNENGLLLNYNFEDGSGTTLTDISPSGNDGTLINMDPSTDWVTGKEICSSCELEMATIVSVTVQDIVAPVADASSLTTLTGECSVSAPTAPTATDACEGSITGTTITTFPITTQGPTTITWTFNDGNGNTSTQDQTVTIDDITDPVLDAVSLTTLTDQCSVSAPTAPTATDNCVGSITGTTTTTFPMTASGTITWTFDDGNDNVITQDQLVTISDVTAPIEDVATLTALTDQCSVNPTAPTATDNCLGTITGTTTTTFPMTTSGTITWTYDDGNGNVITQDQMVTISDVTAPVTDVASLITTTGECQVSALSAPTATDNCLGTITGTTTTTFPITTLGLTVVTWTYDDSNGNITTQDQEVYVTDSYAPVPDVTVLADIIETCEVTSLTDPTATDNCVASITVTNDATLPITIIGTTVVTWTYDDGNGNTSTQTQNVIVLDPMIDITTTTTDFVITANNSTATSYQWIDCNNSGAEISGETNVSYSATTNGDYAVVITEGDCSDTSDCVTIAGVGINELVDLNVSIYPNPNNGEFYVSTSENGVTITIYAVDGKVILNTLKVTETNQLINLEQVESGVYFVKISNEINQKTIRLIIE